MPEEVTIFKYAIKNPNFSLGEIPEVQYLNCPHHFQGDTIKEVNSKRCAGEGSGMIPQMPGYDKTCFTIAILC